MDISIIKFVNIVVLTMLSFNCQAQESDALYLLYNQSDVCPNGNKKFSTKLVDNKRIQFIARNCNGEIQEIFVFNMSNEKITLNKSYLDYIKLTTIEKLGDIKMKERKRAFANLASALNKSTAKNIPIYILKLENNILTKYPVTWSSKALMIIQEDG